jgi:hypothetical protein
MEPGTLASPPKLIIASTVVGGESHSKRVAPRASPNPATNKRSADGTFLEDAKASTRQIPEIRIMLLLIRASS